MHALETALGRMARARLCLFPTPLEPLPNLEKKLNYRGIYIKRDDLTGLGPGGNKLRSLEFIAGEAVAQGMDTLIAAGPVQSNLCTLTAAACARLGLNCVLVHSGEKPEHPTGNVLLNSLLGAEAHYIGDTGAEERAAYVEELRRSLEKRCHPYIVRNGATSGVGALGYANAALELALQHRDKGIDPGTIFAPGGNGGVAAGLIYGNAALGFPFRVVIISVEDDRETLAANIQRTIEDMESLLHLPFGHALEESCVIDDRYRGEGWGRNTGESRRAVLDFPKLEGIFIENVYNSKVLVGMESYIRGGVQGTVCYLHTGGFGSLFSQF